MLELFLHFLYFFFFKPNFCFSSFKAFFTSVLFLSLLIALKLAEYEILKQGSGKKPLLLLDDVFDKLDSFRVSKVMELVAEKDYGQIFITDTHPDRIKQMVSQLNIPAALFEVINGNVEPSSND